MNNAEHQESRPVFSPKQHIMAWAVHAFTMLGILCAIMALLSLYDYSIKEMWLWLGLALIIDGVDGTFARKARVKEVVPWFDGTLLDCIVDYLTWTLIPALYMYLKLPLGPEPLALTLVIAICVTSLFCYCNTMMKSTDYYFVGFPATWNIVALCIYLFGTPAWLNIVASIFLMAITISPITFVHPLRVKNFRLLNLIATAWWIINTIVLVVLYPDAPLWLEVIWYIPGLWLVAIGIWRTIKGRLA